jgi:FKBP-type peptidyl-prolyl cis-trans isomerase SlyD
MIIAKNTIVTLAYEVLDSDGEFVTEPGDKMSYLHGGYDGIFAKVEEGLEGKSAGDAFEISLDPADAFGDYNEELIRMEPASTLPANVEVGAQFEGLPQGEADDRWVVYTVTDIADGQVVLDGNHPLAGERLVFKCTVEEVRSASAEEIEHGHPHGAHGHHH